MAIKNCGQCRLFEGQDQQPELYTVEASEPLDSVHIDFVSMETTMPAMKKPIVQKVLVVIDHFTRFVQAHPVDNEQAETVADTLYNKYFCTFGFPCWLMSDQAQAFVGKVFGKLCQQLQVEKVRTSPYHPQSNGQVERVHQALMRIIGKHGYFEKETLAGTHCIHLPCLQHYPITSDGIFTLFFDVWSQTKNTYQSTIPNC